MHAILLRRAAVLDPDGCLLPAMLADLAAWLPPDTIAALLADLCDIMTECNNPA